MKELRQTIKCAIKQFVLKVKTFSLMKIINLNNGLDSYSFFRSNFVSVCMRERERESNYLELNFLLKISLHVK